MNNLTAPMIQTNRLTLRMVSLEDAMDYFRFCSNPHVCQYLTFNPYTNLLQAKRSIENMIRAYLMGSDVNFSIILNEQNKIIGSISLSFKANNYAEVGYILDEPYWHQNYMNEALNALIKACQEFYHLDGLLASYIDLNVASEKLLLKNHFIIKKRITNGFKKNYFYYTLNQCELKFK